MFRKPRFKVDCTPSDGNSAIKDGFKEVLKQYGLTSAEWLKDCPLTSKGWKINLLYFNRFCLPAEHRSGGCNSDNFAGICNLCCPLVTLP